MMPLVITRTMLHTIKKFCDGIPSDKSLWLNNKLKYKRSPMYIQESINAGLYDYYQLLHSNGTMMIYEVHSISFQTFFVQAFTAIINIIAVNSRYFSMLLLYSL